ncbi:MAG: hypothetical protein K1X89_27455 [Myxococcaceae bacterium]|nr:hypothetical protein [Myxococcaceae bacterium]
MMTAALLFALSAAPISTPAPPAFGGIYLLQGGTVLVLREHTFRESPPPPTSPLRHSPPELRGTLAATADTLTFTPEHGPAFRVTYALDHGVLLLGALVKRGDGYLAELPPPQLLGGAPARVVRWSPSAKRLQVDGTTASGVEVVRRPSAPEVWLPVVPAADRSPWATGADWRGQEPGAQLGTLAARAVDGQPVDRERVFSTRAPAYRDLDGGAAIAAPFTVAVGSAGLWPGTVRPHESAGRYRCVNEPMTLVTPEHSTFGPPPRFGCVPHRPLANAVVLQPDADGVSRQVVACDCQQNHLDPTFVVSVVPLDVGSIAVQVADTEELSAAPVHRCRRLVEWAQPSNAGPAQ